MFEVFKTILKQFKVANYHILPIRYFLKMLTMKIILMKRFFQCHFADACYARV